MTRTLALAVPLFALALPAAAQTAPPPARGETPTLEFVFSELVTLGAEIAPGNTAYGRRNIVPITGGTFDGPGIRGTILPGGWDWQLAREDGCLDIKADYMLKTDDGVVINIVNTGTLCRPVAGQPPMPARTTPVFEAPIGKYDWLSKGAFVGTLAPFKAPDGSALVRIGIWRVR